MKTDNRGSETVGPVGHRDLRSDPDAIFAGPNVTKSSGKPRTHFSSFLGFCLTHSKAYQIITSRISRGIHF